MTAREVPPPPWPPRPIAMALLVVACAFGAAPGHAQIPSAVNLVRNGSMERDVDGDKRPDLWDLRSDAGGSGMLLEETPDGGHCLAVWHREEQPGYTAVVTTVTRPLQAMAWYRVTLLARGADVTQLRIQLLDGRTGLVCGTTALIPNITPDWGRRAAYVRTTDAASPGMLSIAFEGPGELRLDDVSLEELQPSDHNIWPAEDRPNLVYNGSFELGGAGWATLGYGGLVGDIDRSTAVHGQASYRLRWSADALPMVVSDYPRPTVAPATDLQLATLGWLRLQPGKPYSYSLYLKTDGAQLPVQIGMVFLDQSVARSGEVVMAGPTWCRYRGTLTPPSDLAFLVAQPSAPPPDHAGPTLWVDSVVVAPADPPERYVSRYPVELALSPVGGAWIGPAGQPLAVRVDVFNYDDAPFAGSVHVRTIDYFGDLVDQRDLPADVPPGAMGSVNYELQGTPNGVFRVSASVKLAEGEPTQLARVARVPAYPMTADSAASPFGVSRGYPYPERIQAGRMAGLLSSRTLALNWAQIEPEPGQADFSGADRLVDLLAGLGQDILACVPFPSAPWANQATEEQIRSAGVPLELGRQSLLPDDPGAFAAFLHTAAGRYAGRIRAWEVLQEPLVSSYCLPGTLYRPEQYVNLARSATAACREADPGAVLVAGLGTLPRPGRGALPLYREVLALGLGAFADALNVHAYPRDMSPENLARLFSDFSAMANSPALGGERGVQRPIWVTEFGYYADDDPGPLALPLPLLGSVASEREAASFTVQAMVAMLSQGATRVYLQAFPEWANLSASFTDPLFEWDGQPRKTFAAVAALASLLGPHPRPAGREVVAGVVQAYLFDCGDSAVAAIWPIPLHAPARRVVITPPGPVVPRILDEVGNEIGRPPADGSNAIAVPIDRGQTYVMLAGGDVEDLRVMLRAAALPPSSPD